jgi:uncharacterized radical SAM superfamily protein
MPDVSSPDKLKDFCIQHESSGGVGLLISGGSTVDGHLPLEPFLPTLRWVKENTGLMINVHTGMVNLSEAQELAATGIDVASVDIVGSSETLNRVYGLDCTVEEYFETAKTLAQAGVKVAPHICVGLHFGSRLGERRALELASTIDPEVVVLISLIPTLGTPMAEVEAPAVSDITQVVEDAKRLCPSSEISLGCMRSRTNKITLEIEAIKAGAIRVAMASRQTELWAINNGYRVERIDSCCAVPNA